jgi:hypothetical protein
MKMPELSAKDPKCCEITSKAVMRRSMTAFCGINLGGKQNLAGVSARPREGASWIGSAHVTLSR